MSDTKASRSCPGQSPGASPVLHHDDSLSAERTPLLGTDTQSRDFGAATATTARGDDGARPAPISVNHNHHHHHHHHGGAAHEGFDPSSEADLYLARSFSSIPSGLAPEALESNMLRNRGPSPSGGSRRSRSRRPSYSYEYEGSERPATDLGSSISGEDEAGFEPGPGSEESSSDFEDASSLSSGGVLDYEYDGGVDVANNHDVDVEAGPLLPASTNGGGYGDDDGATHGNGSAKKSRHHHQHPQQQREFLIDTDNRRFWLIFVGIMATYFLACFDGTIMASSHPVITSYFRSSNSASWLSTAFLLTNTAFQPMVGRLSDSLGRRGPYLVTMAIFGAATLWCALAQSMTSFIAARAVCGLGAGGMMALGNIIISDLVPIERRGAYQSYVNIVYGIASAAGAALGGLMADKLGWRWEFGIQVFPIALTLCVTAWVVPADLGLVGNKRETLVEAMKAFDFRGSLLLTASITSLILGVNLGGNVLPWSHPFTVASLAISAVCFPACLWVESWVERPIMPLELLHSAPRANMIFANFIASFLLNAILFNVPLFFQAVLLRSATESGLYLVVPTAIASTCGTATGFLITWTRRLKWPLGLGAALYLTGTVTLSSMGRGWPAAAYLACLVPASMGQGFQFPGTFLAVLAASAQREQAVVTSTLVLWRALGSVLGIAASSLVLQNALLRYLDSFVVVGGGGRDDAWKAALIEKVRESVEAVARIADPEVRDQVVRSYEAALRVTFVCCIAVAVVNVLLIIPVRLPRLGERK